ncbi:MAG: FkbM family methyltransferase [Clostridiales bacterium]|jgi:FkbM family methyltransferase|nr:FkbM family methyltransferase [Clostridiales bacterium]
MDKTKPTAAVIIEPDYYKLKERYIERNYDVTCYISLDGALSDTEHNGRRIMPIYDFVSIPKAEKPEKIIIALPFDYYIEKINLYLIKHGVSNEDIVLTLMMPDSPMNEYYATVYWGRAVNYRVSDNGEVYCEVDGRTIIVSNVDELGIVYEIFGARVYDFHTSAKSLTVIDIGMNVGVASIFFASKENVNRVYAFEPFPDTFERALENIALNNAADKVFPHSYGLGETGGELELSYDGTIKGHMSTVKQNKLSPNSKSVTVQIADIAEIFNAIIDLHPDDTFVFKIDCEGGEYEILERLDETGLIKRIHVLMMEWHMIEGKSVSQLEDILRRNGFVYHLSYGARNLTGMIFAVNSIQ